MVWAALGAAGGAGLNYLGDEQTQRRQQDAANGYNAVSGNLNNASNADQQALIDQLKAFTAQRFQSQQALGTEIGSPNRFAAGEAARTDMANRQQQALAGTGAPADRSIAGNQAGYNAWSANSAASRQPVLDARMQLLQQTQAQHGMANYDTGALNRAADTSIDINRQAVEAQQAVALRQKLRDQMLAEAGIRWADPGQGQAAQNLHLWGSVLGAAGSAADSYTANKHTPDYSQTLGYDPSLEDRGSSVHYTYNTG